jgi:hypothetical protein
MARVAIHQLLATDVALDKLAARAISVQEAEQLLRNHHVAVRIRMTELQGAGAFCSSVSRMESERSRW